MIQKFLRYILFETSKACSLTISNDVNLILDHSLHRALVEDQIKKWLSTYAMTYMTTVAICEISL